MYPYSYFPIQLVQQQQRQIIQSVQPYQVPQIFPYKIINCSQANPQWIQYPPYQNNVIINKQIKKDKENIVKETVSPIKTKKIKLNYQENTCEQRILTGNMYQNVENSHQQEISIQNKQQVNDIQERSQINYDLLKFDKQYKQNQRNNEKFSLEQQDLDQKLSSLQVKIEQTLQRSKIISKKLQVANIIVEK